MIDDKGLVTFFELNGCGFYPTFKKNRTDDSLGFDLKETLEGLIEWVKGRSFNDTLPVDIPKDSSRQPILLKSYYKDENTGDYLFVFWQCMSENDGKVGAVVSDSTVGDSARNDDTVNISSEEHNGKKLTPGHPMYYWFIPEFNVFATINFSHSAVATEDVASYIRSAIKQRVKSDFRKVIKDEKGDIKQILFRDVNNDPVIYIFNQRMIDINIDNVNLEQEAKKVTHLVVKEQISKNVKTSRDDSLKLWGMSRKRLKHSLVNQEVETITKVNTTTGKELEDLLRLYYEQKALYNGEIDIGYRTSQTSKTTVWFSKYLNRPHLKMDKKTRGKRASYRAEDILKELTLQRDWLLQNVCRELLDRAANSK